MLSLTGGRERDATRAHLELPHACIFRHNLMGDIDEDDLQELYHNDRLGTVGYTRIEHCILCPFLRLRPWNGQLRMHRAELEWTHAEYMTVRASITRVPRRYDRADARRRMVRSSCVALCAAHLANNRRTERWSALL